MNSVYDKKALIWSSQIFGLPIVKRENELRSFSLEKQLSNYLNQLLKNDFNKLIALLYRVDLSQGKVREALAKNSQKESPGETLAQLIIERQAQKLKTREKYRKENHN